MVLTEYKNKIERRDSCMEIKFDQFTNWIGFLVEWKSSICVLGRTDMPPLPHTTSSKIFAEEKSSFPNCSFQLGRLSQYRMGKMDPLE